MKQTVVDWLEDNLIGNPFSTEDFDHNVNMFKKAKEMEKKQIVDACNSNLKGLLTNGIDYYKDTFREIEKL